MRLLPPSSIKTVGILVSVFAGLIIFSNGSGALVWTFIGMADELDSNQTIEMTPMDFVMSHYRTMCLIMVTLGTCFLIGGINLMKYKLWANRLVTVISAILIVAFLGISFPMMDSMSTVKELEGAWFFPFLVGLVWATPFAILIYYLNRKSIKSHFT